MQSFTHSVFPVALSIMFMLVHAKCNFASVLVIILHIIEAWKMLFVSTNENGGGGGTLYSGVF